MPVDLKTDDVLSSAALVVARVSVLRDIADTAARYVCALQAGDDSIAENVLEELSKLCEARVNWRSE
jgi:hypothetical protein